eukprot:5332818-Pyramimonas_sp.AAC.1
MDEEFPTGTLRKLRAGQPLADGWRASLVGMEADAKARKELHGFRRWYKCTLLCEKCLANNLFVNADASLSCLNFFGASSVALDADEPCRVR